MLPSPMEFSWFDNTTLELPVTEQAWTEVANLWVDLLERSPASKQLKVRHRWGGIYLPPVWACQSMILIFKHP